MRVWILGIHPQLIQRIRWGPLPWLMDFTTKNYKLQIRKLHKSEWINIPKEGKEEILQWLVDYESYRLGLPSICTVKIDKIKGERLYGEFKVNSKYIFIEEEFAIDGLTPPFRNREQQRDCLDQDREIYGTLMHEFRHAFQQYVLEHPEIYKDTEYFKMILYNQEFQKNPFVNLYFKSGGKPGLLSKYDLDEFSIAADILYRIQPVERDAFMYQEEKLNEFSKIMYEWFPNEYVPWSSLNFEFQQAIKKSKIRYETEFPFKEIDDIIKFLNGEDVEKINKQMLNDVEITQKKPLFDIIKTFFDNISREPIGCGACLDMDEYQKITDEGYDRRTR